VDFNVWTCFCLWFIGFGLFQIPGTLAPIEALESYTQISSHPFHKTNKQGIISLDILYSKVWFLNLQKGYFFFPWKIMGGNPGSPYYLLTGLNCNWRYWYKCCYFWSTFRTDIIYTKWSLQKGFISVGIAGVIFSLIFLLIVGAFGRWPV